MRTDRQRNASNVHKVHVMFSILQSFPYRMGRDSNPRWAETHTGFQDRRLKPLGHPSSKIFRNHCSQMKKMKKLSGLIRGKAFGCACRASGYPKQRTLENYPKKPSPWFCRNALVHHSAEGVQSFFSANPPPKRRTRMLYCIFDFYLGESYRQWPIWACQMLPGLPLVGEVSKGSSPSG